MGEGPAGETRHDLQGGTGHAIPRRPAYQRHEEHPAAAVDAAPGFPVSIVADSELGDRPREQVLALIARLEHRAPRPVLHARVVLRKLPDPALARPAIAKATLDVNGRPVRAHVAAKTMDDALDRLEERLRRSLEDLEETRRADRYETGVVAHGEWRHGSLPAVEPEYRERPVEERELLIPDPAPAPALDLEAAIERLNASGERFVFYVDAQTGRGNLLYRRYDGHYGLLEPAGG